MKVLCVCLGNICRSPLAHGILEAKVAAQNLDWEVDSAGTGNYHVGEAPDKRSIAEALKHGIDISKQQARQLEKEDFDRFDHILVMDASNYQHAKALATTQAQRDKVELVMNYADPGRNGQVPDPYWNDDGFAGVFTLLDRALDGFIATIKRKQL